MKLIVIGNGNFTSPQGHLINMFDTVIRLSCFKIKGFEHVVGTKTDIVSVARIENLDPLPPHVWVGNPMGLQAIPHTEIKRAYPNGVTSNPYPCMKAAYLRCGYLENGDETKQISHPTLGLFTIFMAVQFGAFFYETPITITGFDFGHPNWKKYYWGGGEYDQPRPYQHQHPKEREIIKDMIGKGEVKLLDPRDIILMEESLTPEIII